MKCSNCGATEGFAYVPHKQKDGDGNDIGLFRLQCGSCGEKVDPKGQEEECAAAKRYAISVMRSRVGIKDN